MFRVKPGLLVPAASIAGQCCIEYLYDFAPNLEDLLSEAEGTAAELLRQVDAHQSVPDQKSPEAADLRWYIVLQRLRTHAAGHVTDVQVDYLGKKLLEGDESLSEMDLDQFEIRNTYRVALPMMAVSEVSPIAQDLTLCLLRNETQRELISSDHPVVLHNRYCEGIDYEGCLGWNCRGIQVFFPISPTLLLALVDTDVYQVRGSKFGPYTVRLKSERDVAQLNRLQVLNAEAHTYFKGSTELHKTVATCNAVRANRPYGRTVLVETDLVEDGAGNLSSLVGMYEAMLPIRLDLEKLSILRAADRVPLERRAGLQRKKIPDKLGDREDYGRPKGGPITYPVKSVTRR